MGQQALPVGLGQSGKQMVLAGVWNVGHDGTQLSKAFDLTLVNDKIIYAKISIFYVRKRTDWRRVATVFFILAELLGFDPMTQMYLFDLYFKLSLWSH